MSTSTDAGGGHDTKGRLDRRAWARCAVLALGLVLQLPATEPATALDEPAVCTVHPVLEGPLTLPPAAPEETVGVGMMLTGMSGLSGATFQDSFGVTWIVEQAFWYRDGQFVSFDTRYRVRPTDIGSTLQQVARVRSPVQPVSCPDRTNVATTPPVTVVAAPTVKAAAPSKSLRAGQRPLLRIRVSGAGTKPATGIVKIAWRGADSGRTYGELRPRDAGKVSLRLPRLKPGKYRVTATFIDLDTRGLDTSAPTLTIKVKEGRG